MTKKIFEHCNKFAFHILLSMYHYLKVLLFIWIASAALVSVQAQDNSFAFEIFGFEEGLTHRDVTKIQQDTFGFIWLSTVNGLNKYDGYSFKHFRTDTKQNPLPVNYITDFVISPENKIWLSHPNQITVFDAFTEHSYAIALDADGTRGKELTAHNVTVAQEGIFAAIFEQDTGNSQLVYINEAGTVKHLRDFSGKYSRHPLLFAGDSLFVAAVENELWKYSVSFAKDTLELSSGVLYQNFRFKENDASYSRINDIRQTVSGTHYLLNENGQFFYKRASDLQFKKHPLTEKIYKKRGITSFFVDSESNIWLSGRGVLYRFNFESGELSDLNKIIQQKTKYAPNYRQVFQDNSGVVWIATDLGAIKVSKKDQLFTTYMDGGNEYCSSGFCSMRGMAEDNRGNIYFSYYNSIHKLEKTTGVLMPLFPENNYRENPYGLAYCQGAIWTGSGARIDLATLEVDSIFTGRSAKEGLVIAQDNYLWFGCGDSLTQYFPSKNIKIEHSLTGITDTEITFLHKSQTSAKLWVGTKAKGLFELRSDGTTARMFNEKSAPYALSSNRVLGLCETATGQLWCATAAGLTLLDFAKEQSSQFTTANGLPNNFINSVLVESDSIVWLSTDNGLSRFNPITSKANNFYKKDGLPANEFNRVSGFQASDSRLFFGGMNGVVAFYPDAQFSTGKDKSESNLLLTGFSKFDGKSDSLIHFSSSISSDSLLQLSWRDKFFTFNFSLADFNNPEENRYSYILDGYDKEWSAPTHVNMARYNNLPAGDYTFRVRAAAGTDEWNEQELILPLQIDEAFYKKKSFILFSILLAMGLVAAIMQYRLHLIKMREKELEQQVAERTEELEKEKEISDNLLLNILPAETAEELKKYGTTKAKRYEQVTVFFSDFKDFSKIAEELEPEQLVAEIDFCFKGFDAIIDKYNIEKIKTIGDAYMCVAGLSNEGRNAAADMVNAALEIQDFIKKHVRELKSQNRPTFEARIGLHTGAVVSGIVGSKKFAYDIWGDTVNIASRMESHGEVGKVNISQAVYNLVKDKFECTHRGKTTVKSIGETDMYFVEKKK